MRDLVILFVHVIAISARLLGPGGIRSVVAESVLLRQQLLILNRSRQRSPNLLDPDGSSASCFQGALYWLASVRIREEFGAGRSRVSRCSTQYSRSRLPDKVAVPRSSTAGP